jgi:hypothetical protein
MRHTARIGLASSYPPRRTGFAADAAELAGALRDDGEVVVCAVGPPGPHYPTEVVTTIATSTVEAAAAHGPSADRQEQADDYRRAARILVEYGVDAVLIRFDDGIYGGVHGSDVLELAAELRRYGVPYLVSLQRVHPDPDWIRTVDALTARAARVLVPGQIARDWVLRRRLGTADQLRVVPVGVPAAIVATALGGSTTPSHEMEQLLASLGPDIVTSFGPQPDSRGFAAAVASVNRLAVARPGLTYVIGSAPADLGAWVGPHVRTLTGPLSAGDQAALLARTRVYLAVDDAAQVATPRALVLGCPVLTGEMTDDRLADVLGQDRAGVHIRERRRLADRLGWPGVARRIRAVVEETRAGFRFGRPAPVTRTLPSLGADPLPPPRLEWLGRQQSSDARLPEIGARLLRLPVGVLAPSGRAIALGWAARPARSTSEASVRTGLPAAADQVLRLTTQPRLNASDWSALEHAAERLDGARRAASSRAGRGPAWPAFADRLRPGDVRLAHALLAAGHRLGDEELVDRGLESIGWLARRAGLGPLDGVFAPPTAGPHLSVEAGLYVEALAAAFRVTGAYPEARMAQRAMGWFHGANRTADAVYDSELGACRAGLGQAADLRLLSVEASIGYLAALLAVHDAGLVALPSAELARQDLAVVA